MLAPSGAGRCEGVRWRGEGVGDGGGGEDERGGEEGAQGEGDTGGEVVGRAGLEEGTVVVTVI